MKDAENPRKLNRIKEVPKKHKSDQILNRILNEVKD